MIHGIDVSSYQPETYNIDGLDFVFTKVTEGLSYINAHWAAQRDYAKSHGLVWGAYHYPHMATDPHAEADYFLKQVKWAPGDVIVLDWEGYDPANQNVPKHRQLAYRDAWLKYVKGKMPGHKVGMYCNTDYWLHVDQNSTCGDFLWIATGGRPAGDPGITHPWTFHQYSTAGGIDHDVANFPNRAALAAWAGSTTEETDMTPDQAQQLAEIRDLVKYGTWGYKGTGTKDAWALLNGVVAQEAAQTAAIAKLAQLVGSNVDTDAVVAAVQKAIADAVVKVSVDVTGTQGA